ncbi:18135_t:CDS:2, partial [Funneliformis geosporum]
EKYLTDIPTLDDIVAGNDEGLTSNLNDALSSCEKIPFMAIENEGSTERINGTYRYVLRLYSHLINGQKALVTLIDIQIFFDILVPDGETPDKCEEKRKKAIQAIQENNFETASDDLYSFHRKVARENRIQLSGWFTINKYIRKKALLRDRTLILTWDIEIYASQMGEFAEVLEQKNKVFMIGMTLYWKDDPKPLKQICLIDVENASDPRWVTIICGNQVNLLKAFTLCWRAFASDIQESSKQRKKILKWKYHGKIGAKSENNFMMKGKKKDTDEERTIWGSGEKIEEKKDYMGAIKIKITAEEDFFFSFLKLPGCVPIDI